MFGFFVPLWLMWVIVGLIAGWATGKIMRGSGYGVIGDIVLGILGAIVGSWLFRFFGIGIRGGFLIGLLVATFVAAGLVAVARLLNKKAGIAPAGVAERHYLPLLREWRFWG